MTTRTRVPSSETNSILRRRWSSVAGATAKPTCRDSVDSTWDTCDSTPSMDGSSLAAWRMGPATSGRFGGPAILEQQIHVEPIAAVGRHASSGGVRLPHETLFLQPGQHAAHRRRGHAERAPAGDDQRGHRLAVWMYSRTTVARMRLERSGRGSWVISSRLTGVLTASSIIRPARRGGNPAAHCQTTPARSTSCRACRPASSASRASRPRSAARVHQHLPVDEDRADVGGPGGVHQRRVGVGGRQLVRAPRSTTMMSARLPTSIAPISSSSPSVRAPSRVAIHTTSRAVSAPGPSRTAWMRRRQPHLVEHVEPVVARGAVGAERHGDAAPAKLDDRREARAELQVRAGAVHDLDVVLREQAPGRARRPTRSARRRGAERPGRSRPGRHVVHAGAARDEGDLAP